MHVLVVAVLSILVSGSAAAEPLTFEEAMRHLGSTSRKDIQRGLEELAELSDPRSLPALEALIARQLRSDSDGTLYIIDPEDDTIRNALTGEVVSPPSAGLRKPRINNAIRRRAKPLIAELKIRSPDASERRLASEELRKRPEGMDSETLRGLLESEPDRQVRENLQNAIAQLDLMSKDPLQRRVAVEMIGKAGDRNLRSRLEAMLEPGEDGSPREPSAEVRKAAETALAAIDRAEAFRAAVGHLLYGLSLGSILLLAALGLAITFGLMGVINMAHGEMLMLGAYSTVVVQHLYRTYLPEAFDWYLAAAIPAAFCFCALVGMALERGIIRHLYGRPLETLLATWGISLALIQTVRLIFGAQNVAVAHPDWLSGGFELAQGIVLPYSRIAITAFATAVVATTWILLLRTPLGLHVRAVTQNREMASCLGIATARVDMWTFGLGSGIAGLGGVALSQIGNVGPELGQLFIVDSFMVVVLGGVGKIAGSVAAAMSLGIVNKFLEPLSGAVLGKIIVLVFVILFIQRRPQGMFALGTRGN